MHRDITTERGVRPDNIISRLGNEIREYSKQYSLRSSDFRAFIHIVDTDGAFVPNDCITISNSKATHWVSYMEKTDAWLMLSNLVMFVVDKKLEC